MCSFLTEKYVAKAELTCETFQSGLVTRLPGVTGIFRKFPTPSLILINHVIVLSSISTFTFVSVKKKVYRNLNFVLKNIRNAKNPDCLYFFFTDQHLKQTQ